MKDVKSKVALITGGTTGIGLEVAQQASALGIRVVIAGRNLQQGQSAAKAIGDDMQALFIQTDVADEEQVQNLVQQALNRYGQIDFLFNNAGTEGTPGPIANTAAADIDQLLATNIKGTLLLIKHVLPVMLKQGEGVIVNTASFIGTVVPFPDAIPYGATKAAVLSITQAMAAGYGKDNIQTFAVCPWVTDTPMIDRLTGGNADQKTGFGSLNPSGQLARPNDTARVVLQLFTGEMELPNGEAVLVDHGGTTSPIQPMGYEKR